MELKENMYVRTRRGNIAKIIRIEKDSFYKNMNYFALDKCCFLLYENTNDVYEEDVKKASYNLIDLIEVGDYVNGTLITNKYMSANGNWVVENECADSYYSIQFRNKDIKSVVTHEQFKQMEYEVY